MDKIVLSFKLYPISNTSNTAEINITINSINDYPTFNLYNFTKSFEEKVILKGIEKTKSIISVDLNKDGKVDIITQVKAQIV